jgi:hypothetical protein
MPRTLSRFLIDHHMVTEARARGWAELENGKLLDEAEAAGFEVLVTTDKNLSYQQNLACLRSVGSGTLGTYQTPYRANCRRSERGNARQLCRSENTLRVSPGVFSQPRRTRARPCSELLADSD